MKELYISPEMKVLCFAPIESLASGFDINADILLGVPGAGVSENPGGDIDLEI